MVGVGLVLMVTVNWSFVKRKCKIISKRLFVSMLAPYYVRPDSRTRTRACACAQAHPTTTLSHY